MSNGIILFMRTYCRRDENYKLKLMLVQSSRIRSLKKGVKITFRESFGKLGQLHSFCKQGKLKLVSNFKP